VPDDRDGRDKPGHDQLETGIIFALYGKNNDVLGENVMLSRCGIGSLVFAAAMALSLAGAQAHDESKYPDWNGQWRRPPGVNNQ